MPAKKKKTPKVPKAPEAPEYIKKYMCTNIQSLDDLYKLIDSFGTEDNAAKCLDYMGMCSLMVFAAFEDKKGKITPPNDPDKQIAPICIELPEEIPFEYLSMSSSTAANKECPYGGRCPYDGYCPYDEPCSYKEFMGILKKI